VLIHLTPAGVWGTGKASSTRQKNVFRAKKNPLHRRARPRQEFWAGRARDWTIRFDYRNKGTWVAGSAESLKEKRGAWTLVGSFGSNSAWSLEEELSSPWRSTGGRKFGVSTPASAKMVERAKNWEWLKAGGKLPGSIPSACSTRQGSVRAFKPRHHGPENREKKVAGLDGSTGWTE